ncbi:MAG TPA: hypothetical protein VF184_13400 [Phycisphaeraceae bacterium]
MSRRLKQPFNRPELEDLLRQLLFSPPAKRIQQVLRAEQLHDQIDPQRDYPLDFLVYRITGYRPDAGRSPLLPGWAILPDLRLMIDRLSRSVDFPPEAADSEPAQTVEELSLRLNVSVKTISRWRREGLRWRWMRGPAGRRQLMIPQSAIEHFQAQHHQRIEKASRFSHVDPNLRKAVIERARRIAQASDVSLNQVAAHLARRTGRALETIRQILLKHDRDHPRDPIFKDRTGPLTPRQKRFIVRAYRWGIPIGRIAQRTGRTRSTLYRVIREHRAAEANQITLRYVRLPLFEREDADQVILRPWGDDPPTQTGAATRPLSAPNPAGDLPPLLEPLYSHPRLNAARERSLFIRYNYLKFRAARLREGFDRQNLRTADLDRFEQLVREAKQLRVRLVQAHLPTVLSVVRRDLLGQDDTFAHRLLQRLQVGNEVLLEALESFNAARQASFESYLTNMLLRRFAGEASEARQQAHRRGSEDQMAEHILAWAKQIGLGVSPSDVSSSARVH